MVHSIRHETEVHTVVAPARARRLKHPLHNVRHERVQCAPCRGGWGPTGFAAGRGGACLGRRPRGAPDEQHTVPGRAHSSRKLSRLEKCLSNVKPGVSAHTTRASLAACRSGSGAHKDSSISSSASRSRLWRAIVRKLHAEREVVWRVGRPLATCSRGEGARWQELLTSVKRKARASLAG